MSMNIRVPVRKKSRGADLAPPPASDHQGDSMEPWQIYFDELRSRAQRATELPFDRETALAEAAHEAYQHTADRLTREHGWDEDRALVETRGMNETVRTWLAAGRLDWDDLRDRLQQRD
jgi:hypothetical protein